MSVVVCEAQNAEREMSKDYFVGRIEDIRESFYAISVERKITHPAVLAITRAARRDIFG